MTLDAWAWIVAAAVVPIGGCLNRWRGGLELFDLPVGLGKKRVLYCVATALYAAFVWAVVAERVPGSAVLAFVAPFALLMLPGFWIPWGRFMDLGRVRGDRRLEFVALTAIGLVVTGPAGLVLWLGYGSPWFALSGAAMGLLYELAWRTPNLAPGLDRGPPLGELYFGTWLWAVLAASAAIP